MEEVQNSPALAADRAVERVPDGSVNAIVDGVQTGDGDQRTGRTAQFDWEVKFSVINHFAGNVVQFSNRLRVKI